MNQWRKSKRFLRRIPFEPLHTSAAAVPAIFVHRNTATSIPCRSLSDDSFSSFDPARIRNFSIIAHVDHGKSTLADRLIESGGVKSTQPQQLDSLQVERERGITVKAQSVALRYCHKGVQYLLNLIDTPGHVDFGHEVGRSLFLSDGAVLLVDATQGIQAQTVSNFYSAFEMDLMIIGAVNKIDLPRADVESCKSEMLQMFDLDECHVTCLSSKTGENVEQLLRQIVEHIPPPLGDPGAQFQGILHDCTYLRGLVLLTVFVKNGSVSARQSVYLLGSQKSYVVKEMGVFLPALYQTESLSAGQVGYFLLKVPDIQEIIIGDTICSTAASTLLPIQTISKPKPAVFSGVYPDEEGDFGALKEALEKLRRSDTSLSATPAQNHVLGRGWTLGFLGTLHREVFAERLHQEFGASVVMTPPTVTYRALMKEGTYVEFSDPSTMPDSYRVQAWEEPVVSTTIVLSGEYMPDIISYCMECRGEQKELATISEGRYILKYDIPLAETVTKFYSNIKRLSSGYASCDFESAGYWETELSKVDVLLNGVKEEGLARIVRTPIVREVALTTVQKLSKEIPRQLFRISIQCAVGGKVQARADVKPVRKDVTKDLYGGDKTRAQKLIKQQAEGKKKLRATGKIKIPRDVFRNL